MVTAPARRLRRPGTTSSPRSRPASSTAATSSRSSATRARPPTACPSCTSSPRRSACCRTAASGSRSSPTAGCPARPARSRPPSTSPPRPPLGGPLSRVRDGDLITVDADDRPARPATSTRPSWSPPATGRAPQGAEWAGTGRELFAAFRATVGTADTAPASSRRRRSPSRRSPLSSPSESSLLLDLVPVVPVVVVDDVATRRAAGPRAGRRRPAGHRADPAYAGRARRDPARSPPRCRRSWSAPARRSRPARPSRRTTRARSSWSPRAATPALLGAMADTGLPFLPGTATVSEVLAVLEAGLTEMKFFPAEASGGAAFLTSVASPVPGRPVLPDRRDHRGHRGVVPRAAERRLRRRLLAHPQGPRRRRVAWATGRSRPSPARPPPSTHLLRRVRVGEPRCVFLRAEVSTSCVPEVRVLAPTVRCCGRPCVLAGRAVRCCGRLGWRRADRDEPRAVRAARRPRPGRDSRPDRLSNT